MSNNPPYKTPKKGSRVMIKIKEVTMESIYDGTRVRDRYVTVPLYLNEKAIVSIRPLDSWQTIKEVNNTPVNSNTLTEIVYSVGSNSKKVIVLGEFTKLVELINQGGNNSKRELLNG